MLLLLLLVFLVTVVGNIHDLRRLVVATATFRRHEEGKPAAVALNAPEYELDGTKRGKKRRVLLVSPGVVELAVTLVLDRNDVVGAPLTERAKAHRKDRDEGGEVAAAAAAIADSSNYARE